MKLNKEEKAILKSVEKGEWRSISTPSKLKRYKEYAKVTFIKDKRINIRISGKDLTEIQKKALIEGLPYQTLVSSILHKYISGRLVERKTG